MLPAASDQVLSQISRLEQIRFRNLVNLDDLTGMRQQHAEYVILHKHFEAGLYRVARPLPTLERLEQKYRQTLGAPFYEDPQVVVFRL